jgi:hypothetical protein
MLASAVSASRHPEVAKLGAEPEETKELNPESEICMW